MLTGEDRIRSMKEQLQQVKILMPPNRFTDFKIQKYYENEPNFNGAYSRNNLSEAKDGTCTVNLDESESLGTH